MDDPDYPIGLIQPRDGPWEPFHAAQGTTWHRDLELDYDNSYAVRGSAGLFEVGRIRSFDVEDFKPFGWLQVGSLTPDMLRLAGESYLPWSVGTPGWCAPYRDDLEGSWVMRGRAFWHIEDRRARYEIRAFPAEQAASPAAPLREGGYYFGELDIAIAPSDFSWMPALADWLEADERS